MNVHGQREPGEPAPGDSGAVPARRSDGLLARTDSSAAFVRAAQLARRLAPEDLPSARGAGTLDRLTRVIEDTNPERPSAMRELGLASVAVWRSLLRRRPPDPSRPLPATILFTDLVDFSRWALRVGDDQVLALIGEVNRVCEETVRARGGQVVKTLGDGMMAVFVDGQQAIEAAHEATVAVSAVHLADYRPALRAGLHTGAPRAVGDDFLGVDVNIAARVCAAAGAGEVLASATTLEVAGVDHYAIRRRRFRAKGVPRELRVYRVLPRYDDRPPGGEGR